jgi:Pro-kumamolisin, activation domain/Abnormal spindle-like microcephaly-assoc'd, ASPM-SPD-2-Hydin/Subtilase family
MTVPKGYVAVPGSDRRPARGAKRVADADPAEVFSVTIRVRRRPDGPPIRGLDEWAKIPLNQRKFLTREELAAAHGASPDDLAAVVAFAEDAGLTVSHQSAGQRTVVVSGTTRRMQAAFGVKLGRYESPAETYRGREGSVHVPAALGEIVESVLGLDNRTAVRPSFTSTLGRPGAAERGAEPRTARRGAGKPAAGPAGASALTPPQVAGLYNFPTNKAGSQTVAILEFGGGYATSDVTAFLQPLGIATPTLIDQSVGGATNSPAATAKTFTLADPDLEVILDIDVMASIAVGATIVVYFANNTDQGYADAVSAAVHDSTHQPTVISVSWGGSEDGWTGSARTSMVNALTDAANLGVTVFFSSGDDGSDNGVGDGSAHCNYPASEDGVIACGGTYIANVSGKSFTEGTWNDGGTKAAPGGATGGGVSDVYGLPSWQDNIGVPKSANDNTTVGRGVPDVSGNASPFSGYTLTLYGTLTTSLTVASGTGKGSTVGTIGGTSAVAPLYAGLLAVIEEQIGKPLGYLNPLLYALQNDGPIVDINDGANNSWAGEAKPKTPYYTCVAGWDACTGLGRLDGGKLLSAFQHFFGPEIAVSLQDDLHFGTVCEGPAYRVIHVYNVGDSDLWIQSVQRVAGSTDFTVLSAPTTPLAIAPGAQVDFTVAFSPTTAGVLELATIQIVSNDPVTPDLDVQAQGRGGAAILSTAIANSGDFGNVCLGSFVDEPLTINNSGTCPLLITSITGSANFLTPSVLAYPLRVDSGDSIDVVVRFAPSTQGPHPGGTITIFSNDPASPHVVPVSGFAPAPKANLIIANTGDFGEVRLGKFTDREIVINNPGPCPLSVTGLVSSAPVVFVTPSVVGFPLTVDGGGSIALPIRFQPTNRGSAAATLTILSNDPSSPAVVPVSGTAWPPLPIAGSPLTGYRLSNDSQHVHYIGTDKHVHELYITTGAVWVDNDLTDEAGAVPPTVTSSLEGFPLSDDSQHVFFIGTDGHVYELYITAGAGWVYNDLTALARAVPPNPTTALDGYRLSDDSKHVNYIGTDGHVHELYITRGGRWVDNDLTSLAGAVPPIPTTALDGYPLSDDSEHVFFIGTDHHVHELYLTRGAAWVDNDLTALAGAVPPIPTTALDGYRLSDDSKHVNFIGTDHHVHELYIHAGASWVDNDLTAEAGAVPPTATSALDGFPLSDDSQHLFFIGADTHVHELYITAGAGWVDIDLTTLAGAVPPIPTTALDGYRLSDDSKHVNFIGTDNHVHELYIHAGAGWVDNDLTALT